MKNQEKYIIGIDAGATSTEGILSKFPCKWESCKGVNVKQFPPINFNLLGKKRTIVQLNRIIKALIKYVESKNVLSVIIGIAGARIKKDRELIKEQLKKITKIKNIKILPDTEIALASVFEKNEKNCGILIAGTGSILYYKDGKGNIKRIGGWGRHIGDEGSGYWIGREALRHITKCYDGYGEKTMLLEELKKHHDIHIASLIRKVYHENFEISKLAKHVFDCAEKGDRVSINIIKKAAEHLADHLIILKRTKAKIALLGSLFSEEKLLVKYFRKIIQENYPNITLIKSESKPVWGAVKIGMSKLNN